MNELKRLQGQYKAGKITHKEYLEQLKALLDDGDVSQEEHDEAKGYDPDDEEEGKPIYTQADLDRLAAKKGAQYLRKALKEAGIEVDAPNKELVGKLADILKDAKGTGEATADEKEVAELRKQAAKAKDLEAANQKLTVEVGVMKVAAKYDPHNQAQVVRALMADYKDLLEYDDESGVLVEKSVVKAVKRIAETEPNLFKNPEGKHSDEDDEDGSGDEGNKFKGKGPGGPRNVDKQKAAEEATLNEMRELMGIKNN